MEAFNLIGRTLHGQKEFRAAWKEYIAQLFKNTLTLNHYRFPEMDKLADDMGERFVTEWINKVIK